MASHEGERFLLGDVEVRPEGLSFFGFSIPWQTLRITQPELLAKLRDAVKNGSLEEVLDALSNLKIRSQKDPHTWLLWTLGKLN